MGGKGRGYTGFDNMPHFGHMEDVSMPPEKAELFRARLHIRAARRRFRQGKVSSGISVLFDSFISALRWYVASPGNILKLDIRPGDDLNDEQSIYGVLVRSGVLDGRFGYGPFYKLMEDAVNKKLSNFDFESLLKEVEAVITALGVMPFDEASLPPEKPGTP